MPNSLVCWKCGASFAELSLPLSRLDECRQCHAELHVCKLCEWHSVTVAKQCRETIAEEVKDKERANFCDYFKPRADAYSMTDLSDAAKAKSALDALFAVATSAGEGSNPSPQDTARARLDALFSKKR